MSLETPTWDKITSPLGSTTSEFGGSWANLISDYYNGTNIALIDASKIPIIGTLTRYKFEKLGIFDTDQSHHIVFSADDIDTGPARKIRFRRMNTPYEEDFAVLEGLAQALINKTINADLNTITNIENADIKVGAAISDNKLAQITDKAKLPATSVYTDQVNTFGDFNNTFRSSKLRLSNPANTFFYNWTGSAIAADRTITIPLLTGNDELLLKDFAATITNKSISGSTNTLTNIGDSAISSHTSTKITITTKGQLNSNIVYNDQTNSFGDFAQTFKDNQLKINNPADTFAYTIIAAAIGANRSLTLPLLIGNDTAVTEAFTQALTNKTIDADQNTLSNIENADIKAAAAIATTKLADSANFILKTLDNSFGAHYFDMTRISAPSNPAANDGRIFIQQVDTNNDAAYIHIKKNGSFQKVFIA